MKYLIVVDMQNDFVTGSLGSQEAQAILPKVLEKAKSFDGTVIFTKDTHGEDYLNTQEGKNLPVEHCILHQEGWHLADALEEFASKAGCAIYEKPAFGSVALATDLARIHAETPIQEIELCGLCTDICVISNALMLKAFLPEVPVCVDAACCAGVTPKSHQNALDAMAMCQVRIRQ